MKGTDKMSEVILETRNLTKKYRKANGITYICLPPKLPEDDVIARIQKAFFDAHIYSRTPLSEDLKIIKQRYSRWKNKS